MSEGTLGDLQSEGTEDNVGKRGEKVNCNGEVLRTSDPLKDCSRSENTEQLDTTGGAGDEQTASYSKDSTTHSNHNSESSSSEDETEGQGDFAANWYVPLPQDPGESDEEEGGEGEGSEQWSEAAIRGQPLLRKQDGEEEGEGQGASSQQVEEVKAASQMEDSQVEAIKQAMAGFSLPLGSQPQWARVVPENVWKAELIGGLQQKQRHKSKAKSKQKKT